jgi:regulator of protease activity HflC (stomatin/prohibitin superfamily)
MELIQVLLRAIFGRNNRPFHNHGRAIQPSWVDRVKKIGIILAIIFAGLSGVVAMFSEGSEPWEVMVKQTKMGENAGYDENIYPGGYRYLLVPFKETMHHFDTRLKFLSVTTEVALQKDGTYQINTNTGVKVPTADGSFVFTDVTIAYQLFREPEHGPDGELIHGGPNELRKRTGIYPAEWEKLLLQNAEERFRRALGSLETDDYYNSVLSEKRVAIALERLNKGWTDEDGNYKEGWHQYGIDVVAILPRAYYYLPVIDRGIASKNLQIQQDQLNQAREKEAENLALVADERAKGEAKVKTLKNQKEWEAKTIISRGEKYQKIQFSAGDSLVGKAEAYAQELKAKAMETGGSELYVAQQLAPLVGTLKGGVVSDINPFDISAWIDKFVGKAEEK